MFSATLVACLCIILHLQYHVTANIYSSQIILSNLMTNSALMLVGHWA